MASSPLEERLVASLSSDEEEEDSDDEEEVDSGEEEEVDSSEEVIKTEPKMNNNNNKKPETQPQSSSEEECSDSDSSDHPPVVTLTKSSKKRAPVENENENSGDVGKESKRARKNSAVAAAEAEGEKKKEKKPLFQRIWSLDDEPVILNGIMDYSSKTGGADPFTEGNAFHKFINESLSIKNVTSTQLLDKMRKLKLKYKNNVAKGKTTFSESHQQKVYDLSMTVWGRPTIRRKKEEEMIDDKLLIMMSNHQAAESVASFIEEGLSLIDLDKKSELNEKLRKLQLVETKMFMRRSELQCELAKLCLDAVDNNNKKKKKKKKN